MAGLAMALYGLLPRLATPALWAALTAAGLAGLRRRDIG